MASADELIRHPKDIRPHVVVLGAGASCAAFPNGDAKGRALPDMSSLVATLGLDEPLRDYGFDPSSNFEALYSQIASAASTSSLRVEIEQRVRDYFSGLRLPASATHYDRLLLSLRGKDAVFTFNWDPFLFDAFERNHGAAPLPGIFFLHGNVRAGACTQHDTWGKQGTHCPTCGVIYTPVPLLYPVEKKDYSNNEYIRGSWDCARELFSHAFTLLLFGYGAPQSDAEAVRLLRSSYFKHHKREIETFEVIDKKEAAALYEKWEPFTPTHHLSPLKRFEESSLWRWPRRSCEALLLAQTKGEASELFCLPHDDSLARLQDYAADIAQNE